MTRLDRPMAIAYGVVNVVLIAVVVEMLRVHGGVAGTELASSWQLLDLGVLAHDPFVGVWYLHTQPPLHNLVIGLAAWSPLPLAGTVFVLYVSSLAVMTNLLLDLLVRWRVPVVAATVVVCLAVADPALLSTVRIASYEVPLAALLVGLVWTLDRYLAAPTARRLAVVVGLGVALVMTRALFHPLWLAVVLTVVLLARRPTRRMLLAAVAVPMLVIGGWILKNAVLVDSASLSSWTGFNLQRGVVGPMPSTVVVRAIDAGDVSSLARQTPWQDLSSYAPWLQGCRPADRNAALSDPVKVVGGVEVPNFNNECYVRLYQESSRNAITLAKHHPGDYLRARLGALGLSYAYAPLGHDRVVPTLYGERLPATSWMDRVFSVLMVRQRVLIDTSEWNLPLYGERFPFQLVWPLAAASAIVMGRAAVAAWRMWRTRPEPDGHEVVWLVAGITVLFVAVGGDLVELGENGRFRSMLDPMVFALVTVEMTALGRRVMWRVHG